jgi:hypothetical protein
MKLMRSTLLGFAAVGFFACGGIDSLGTTHPRRDAGVGGSAGRGGAAGSAGKGGSGGRDCSAVSCEAKACRPGERLTIPPGECCGTCEPCGQVACAPLACDPRDAHPVPGECCWQCASSDGGAVQDAGVACPGVVCAPLNCDPATEVPRAVPGKCCGECVPLGSDYCVVEGKKYREGESVPDPFSCNMCTCRDGKPDTCTERSCPEPCPDGTVAGSRCLMCGPAGGCTASEVGCLPRCSSDSNCSPDAPFCVQSVCSASPGCI